jgi:hypothetical protein
MVDSHRRIAFYTETPGLPLVRLTLKYSDHPNSPAGLKTAREG